MRMQLAALLVCAPALTLAADWKPADNPLTTPWTAQVTAGHALPEYPRPQLVRTRWTNLNGLWDYAIRPKAEDRPAQFEGKLLVPLAARPHPSRESAPRPRRTSAGGIAAAPPPRPRRARACCSTSARWIGAPRSSSTARRPASMKAATTRSRSISPAR